MSTISPQTIDALRAEIASAEAAGRDCSRARLLLARAAERERGNVIPFPAWRRKAVAGVLSAACAALMVTACIAPPERADAAEAPSLVAFYSPYSRQVWRVFIPGALASPDQNDAFLSQAESGCGCASLPLSELTVKSEGFSRTFEMAAPAPLPVSSWGQRPNAYLSPPRRFDRVIAEALEPTAPPAPMLIEAPR